MFPIKLHSEAEEPRGDTVYLLSAQFVCQEAILFSFFLLYMIRIVVKYYSRLTNVAKFFILSFTTCFLLELSKTIFLMLQFGHSIDTSDEWVYKMVCLLLSPIQAYIYLKYCYAVYLMYRVQATLRFQDSQILLRQ